MDVKKYNNALDKSTKNKDKMFKFNRYCYIDDSVFDNDCLSIVLTFHMPSTSLIIRKRLSCISIYLC